MSYIYGIFYRDIALYIGQTKRDPHIREKEHRKDIDNKCHKIKALNKLNNEDIEFRVLLELDTDNTLLLCFAECLMNSIYKPKNRCILQQGRNKVILQRCDVEFAKKLIEVILDGTTETVS